MRARLRGYNKVEGLALRRYCFGGSDPAPQNSNTTTSVQYSPTEQAARNNIQTQAGNLYSSFMQPTGGSVPAPAPDAGTTAWRTAQKAANPNGFMDTKADGTQFLNTMGADAPELQGQMVPGGPSVPPAYPGATVAPPASPTLQAQNYLTNFAGGAGSNMATQASQALQFGLKDVLNPSSNPALQQTIDTATRKVGEEYTDPNGVLSKIRGNFVGNNSGDGTGSREGIAGGLAARSYLNTVGDVTGKITSDAYTQGLDTFSKTLAFAPNAYNLGVQPGLTLDAVGQQQQAQQQAGLDYDAASRQWGINSPWDGLSNYANIVYGGSQPTTTTSGTAPGATSNKTGAAIGGALQGGAMGAMVAGASNGAIAGPWGMAIGAGAGLLMSMMASK